MIYDLCHVQLYVTSELDNWYWIPYCLLIPWNLWLGMFRKISLYTELFQNRMEASQSFSSPDLIDPFKQRRGL